MMGLVEFLKRLEKTEGWELNEGLLRRESMGVGYGYQCPLTAVAGIRGSVNWVRAVRRLKMNMSLAARIAHAADNIGRSPLLRAKLLAACGIKGRG